MGSVSMNASMPPNRFKGEHKQTVYDDGCYVKIGVWVVVARRLMK
jgi:hypothetical protein